LKVEIATEDGSLGCRGRATDLLKKHLDVERIYSCGPKPMLKAVSEIAHRHGICAQLSLEEHMGCAIGACLGCVVMTRGGLKRVCKEGPVFEADELIWER
jgi:dihydroorotate dehydrogenase electron transfer subunit